MEILPGRKIPREYENPIDDKLLLLCDKMTNFCVKYNITPNQVTLIRFYFIFIIYHYLFNTNNYIIPCILIFIFYLFDCLDGHLARKTNKVTVLGDIMDHMTDLILCIVIYYYIYKNKHFKLLIFLLIINYLTIIHLDLQQKHNKILKPEEATDELLDLHKYLYSFDNHHISWTKYFGAGTFIFLQILIVYYIKK